MKLNTGLIFKPESVFVAGSNATLLTQQDMPAKKRGVPTRASTQPVLVTVPNVPILEAGIEYKLSTGPRTFTPEDLVSAVMAENQDDSIPSPRLKIGHTDPRFNNGFDGEPAFGKAVNLRLSDNGMTVYADYVGVPQWLANIMPSAYPSRSIEGFSNISSNRGKDWDFVISAVSLLGVEWPGVTDLEDLPMYYGAEMPPGVVVTPVAAAGGDPIPEVTASANLDDVRRAFYDDYCDEHEHSFWWWIRAVLLSPNELIVEDDDDGSLFRLPFKVSASGAITFGEAVPVKIEYVDQTVSAKAAAVFVAAGLCQGREVQASYTSRAESRPSASQGGAMDPQLEDLRNRLGLPPETTEEQLQQIADTVATAVPATLGPPEPATTSTGPTAEPVVNTPVAASAGETTDGDGDGEGGEPDPDGDTVTIDKATFAELRAGAALAVDLHKRQREADHTLIVNAAISDGRIPPSRREHWLKALNADEEGAKATLAGLAPGLIPVSELGADRLNDGEAITEGDAYPKQLFPELAQREAEMAARGGIPPRVQMERFGR